MARVRTNKNICLYCFGDLDSSRVCMNCHRKADDTPSPPHHLPQRTVIGTQNRYLMGKALGEGGFGITYLAWDLQQGIKVAVKEYFPAGYVTRVAGNNQVIINSKQNQAASNRGLKRFVEEARALAKIKNLSGVVNVRDFFTANSTAYIVMEFLDGMSLKKYLQRKGGKISVDEILTIMRPVMDSLIQVHKIGLIHRDISPDNILITKYNEVKLIDFGAAKYSNPDGRSLSIVLKQGFAPPEQYDSHGEQGPWTDVYALGVTIYYAITGTLPPESIRIMMGKETLKRPSELGIVINPGVENALLKSLAVDKKKRFQDVQEMVDGLYNPRAPRKTVAAVAQPTPSAPKKTVIPRTSLGDNVTTAQTKTPATRTPLTSTPFRSTNTATTPFRSTTTTPSRPAAPTPAAKSTPAASAKTPAVTAAKSTPAATAKTTPATAAKSTPTSAAKTPVSSAAKASSSAAKTPTSAAAKAAPATPAKSTSTAAKAPTASAAKSTTAKVSAQKAEPAAPASKADEENKKPTGGLFHRLFKK